MIEVYERYKCKADAHRDSETIEEGIVEAKVRELREREPNKAANLDFMICALVRAVATVVAQNNQALLTLFDEPVS
jgi:hypothetical protein